jgi:hypothetical protein
VQPQRNWLHKTSTTSTTPSECWRVCVWRAQTCTKYLHLNQKLFRCVGSPALDINEAPGFLSHAILFTSGLSSRRKQNKLFLCCR